MVVCVFIFHFYNKEKLAVRNAPQINTNSEQNRKHIFIAADVFVGSSERLWAIAHKKGFFATEKFVLASNGHNFILNHSTWQRAVTQQG